MPLFATDCADVIWRLRVIKRVIAAVVDTGIERYRATRAPQAARSLSAHDFDWRRVGERFLIDDGWLSLGARDDARRMGG